MTRQDKIKIIFKKNIKIYPIYNDHKKYWTIVIERPSGLISGDVKCYNNKEIQKCLDSALDYESKRLYDLLKKIN